MTTPVLAFHVEGLPAPQGSKDTFRRGGRVIVVEASKAVKPWRKKVQAAAMLAANRARWVTLDEPVKVVLTFRFARPKSHYGTGRNANVLKASAPAKPTSHGLGDIDKLERATFDALTEAKVYVDDKLITLVAVRKRWAELDGPHGPGASIIVMPDTDEAAA
jgi:crossover junction endodeoxyribonuclease RusA